MILQAKSGLLAALLCIVLAACGESGGVVKWPAVSELDEATHRLVAAAESAPDAEFRKQMLAWSEAAMLVSEQAPPKNVANREKVLLLQKDIGSIAESAANSGTMPGDIARRMARGMESAVHSLMESAGMPHVHGHGDEDRDGDSRHEHEAGDSEGHLH